MNMPSVVFNIGAVVGIIGYSDIANNLMINGMTMASGSIAQAGIHSLGKPAQDHDGWNKNYAWLR